MRIALLHGWGFDAGVWDALAPMLPGQIIRMDRGYFGAAADCGRPDVMIGHSLGAMLLARRWPDVPLVAINGFDRFCGPDAVAPALSSAWPNVLRRMRRGFWMISAPALMRPCPADCFT
jgi:pimeloyl-ACP methyl ester carboxylesterase